MRALTPRAPSALAVVLGLLMTLPAAGVSTLVATPAPRPPALTLETSLVAGSGAVIGTRTIGRSVRGRPIRAYRLGRRSAAVTAVVLGAMHGDEKAGMQVVDSLRRGRPVTGVDLWVIPTMNPDGVAATRRQNARGVDLNRNFPHQWAPLSGSYYSGPRAASEPETRAVLRFLNNVNPRYVISFHQPLYGVGRSAQRRPFQRRLARGLGLPIKSFNCSGVCHGTMTSWFNARHRGTAITVEFGSSPGSAYLRGRATRGTLRAVGGSYD